MTIAVADSIHIVTAALAGVSRGLDRNEAIIESLRSNAWPVFLTSATTAGGFLTLNSSDSPPFHVLGNLVAFGVLCAFIYSMTLLPALLSVLPLRARPVRPDQPGFFDRFGAFVIARRTFLLFFFSLLTVVLISGIPRNELTDNWTQYFDDRYRFRSDTDFVLENLTVWKHWNTPLRAAARAVSLILTICAQWKISPNGSAHKPRSFTSRPSGYHETAEQEYAR